MIYLDSCLVIYAVEPNGAATEAVLAAIADVDERFVISPLVMMECLVGPIRTCDRATRRIYEQFFESLDAVPLTTEVFRLAAELRAGAGLRTPDAIHLAAAQLGGCEALWTNDHRFARVAGEFAVVVVGT